MTENRAGLAVSLLTAGMIGFASATQLDPTAELRRVHFAVERQIDEDGRPTATGPPGNDFDSDFQFRVAQGPTQVQSEDLPAFRKESTDGRSLEDAYGVADAHYVSLKDYSLPVLQPRTEFNGTSLSIDSAYVYMPNHEEQPSWSSYSGSPLSLPDSALGGTGYLVNLYRGSLFAPTTESILVQHTTHRYSLPSDLLQTYEFGSEFALQPGLPRIVSGNPSSFKNNLNTLEYATADVIATMASEVRDSGDLPRVEAENLYNSIVNKMEDLKYFVTSEVRALQRSIESVELRMSRSEKAIAENAISISRRVDLRRTFSEMPQRMVNRAADASALKLGVAIAKSLAKVITVIGSSA